MVGGTAPSKSGIFPRALVELWYFRWEEQVIGFTSKESVEFGERHCSTAKKVVSGQNDKQFPRAQIRESDSATTTLLGGKIEAASLLAFAVALLDPCQSFLPICGETFAMERGEAIRDAP